MRACPAVASPDHLKDSKQNSASALADTSYIWIELEIIRQSRDAPIQKNNGLLRRPDSFRAFMPSKPRDASMNSAVPFSRNDIPPPFVKRTANKCSIARVFINQKGRGQKKLIFFLKA
jgi:hypothetical protein